MCCDQCSVLADFLFCLARGGNGVEDIPSAATFNVITNDISPSIISNGIGKGSIVESVDSFCLDMFSPFYININNYQ